MIKYKTVFQFTLIILLTIQFSAQAAKLNNFYLKLKSGGIALSSFAATEYYKNETHFPDSMLMRYALRIDRVINKDLKFKNIPVSMQSEQQLSEASDQLRKYITDLIDGD